MEEKPAGKYREKLNSNKTFKLKLFITSATEGRERERIFWIGTIQADPRLVYRFCCLRPEGVSTTRTVPSPPVDYFSVAKS